MKQQSTLKKIMPKLFTIGCLAVILYAAHGLFDIFHDYYKNRKQMSDVQEVYESNSMKTHATAKSRDIKTVERTAPNQPKINSQFDELLEKNGETIGWIEIDDTKINYPILQSDNNTDYLDKGFDGEETVAGSLFLDYRNDIIDSSERNYIVYGHRLKDGSMFTDLTKYLNKDFFESQRTFTFDTLYGEYEAEVFSVYSTLIDFNYIQTDFSSNNEYGQLLSKMLEKSIYESDVEVDSDDQIITLSTCEYTLDPNDSRLVIHGKLTKK